MAAMILLISSEEAEIFSMAAFSSFTCSTLIPSCPPACSTYLPASTAAKEVRWALWEMSVMVAASSSTELACSVAPCAKDWAPLDTCALALDTCAAEPLIWRIAPLSSNFRVRMEWRMLWKSPT